MKKQTGFTFIEIMIAIGLVALLSTIAFSFYRDEVTTTEDAVLVEQLDEASRQLTVYTSTHEPIERCEDAASKVKLPDFDSNAVNLRLDFAPIDETDPALGQRAVAVVSTDPDSNMDVARDIHTSLGNKVAPGAVLTDSLISFSVYLSPAGDPFCNSISGAVATNSQLPPAPAPGPAAPSCKSNEIVSSANGACIKACNAGFHLDGGKCVMGDCPAGQTLDGSGYCIAAAPPPPPPPPPAPDPAAKLAGTTTDPAANLAGTTTDPAAKSAGTTTDPAAKLTGPAPAATLQTPASSNPPPPPPPPPAPDPAANLAGDSHAYMQGTDVVIHHPEMPTAQFRYANDTLIETTLQDAFAKKAAIWATLPTVLYQQKLYTPRPAS